METIKVEKWFMRTMPLVKRKCVEGTLRPFTLGYCEVYGTKIHETEKAVLYELETSGLIGKPIQRWIPKSVIIP